MSALSYRHATTTTEWLIRNAMFRDYHDGMKIPAGFRTRVREHFRLIGVAHRQRRLGMIGWEKVHERAFCVLAGKHRARWTAERVYCLDCGAARKLPSIVMKNSTVIV